MTDYDNDDGFAEILDGPIWEKRLGYDADGHEQREACLAIAECPVCGQDVELIAETDEWVRGIVDSRLVWKHAGYGPSTAEHCGKLIADWWEGTFTFDLLAREQHRDAR